MAHDVTLIPKQNVEDQRLHDPVDLSFGFKCLVVVVFLAVEPVT